VKVNHERSIPNEVEYRSGVQGKVGRDEVEGVLGSEALQVAADAVNAGEKRGILGCKGANCAVGRSGNLVRPYDETSNGHVRVR
jgi:hypothetical protein